MLKYSLNLLREKKYTALAALQSAGFSPVVNAIRDGYPAMAEAMLLDLEADHAAHSEEYSTEENIAIEQAIEECWKRIDRLNRERKGA